LKLHLYRSNKTVQTEELKCKYQMLLKVRNLKGWVKQLFSIKLKPKGTFWCLFLVLKLTNVVISDNFGVLS